MRVASIPATKDLDFNFEIKLSNEMQSDMRVAFYSEGASFQQELKNKARTLKTDVFQLYSHLLFYKVYEAKKKFIKEKLEAQNWNQYYAAVARGVDPEMARKVLGLPEKDSNEPAQ